MTPEQRTRIKTLSGQIHNACNVVELLESINSGSDYERLLQETETTRIEALTYELTNLGYDMMKGETA